MPAKSHLSLRRLVTWISVLLAGSLLGMGLRLALSVCGVLLLQSFGNLAAGGVGLVPSADPVYTRAMLRSLADLHVQGLAIGGPPGAALHALLPTLVVDPARAHLAAVRIALEPGSALVARLFAAAFAHAGMLTIGALLFRAGWLRHQMHLMLLGLAVQAQVALSVVGAQPSVRELDATGMSFAANALLPWLWQRGQALTDGLGGVPSRLLAASLVSVALLIGYVPAVVLVLVRARARIVTFGSALLVVLMSAACAGVLQPTLANSVAEPSADVTNRLAAEPVPAVSAWSPIEFARPPVAWDRWYSEPSGTASPGPSHVEVQGTGYRYRLLVNGQPQVITGMGLNIQYTTFLTPEQRAAHLDADMAALSQLGVNTVVGWDEAEFDQVLLDAAQRHAIGVVLPFYLDPQADYTDAAVRRELRDRVLEWVARYRDHPALRMWGLGNEVLHKIVHPAWVGPQGPAQEQTAEAFSDWLIETSDAIHAADPNHPVTYREAEDAFVPWVASALQRRGGGPRPWFVWGTNCYQDYLSQIVDNWPGAGMEVALWVSEFAPGTMAVPDRPQGFETMWGYVRRHPEWVLGGAAYAWTRNGPEGVDRNFGLTDDGVPVDGLSLDRLASMFHRDNSPST